jgi:hypothetical protein
MLVKQSFAGFHGAGYSKSLHSHQQLSGTRWRFYEAAFVHVTDMGKKECVDPEGNGVTMGRGAEGCLAHPVGNKISSWSAAVEEARLPGENKEDSKTGPMQNQELIMHRVRNIVK